MYRNGQFLASKSEILKNISQGIDYSPKGSIDAPVKEIVSFINELQSYVTTSSCAGRISLYYNSDVSKGVEWILVNHGLVSGMNILETIERQKDDRLLPIIYLKCEAFILHILCDSIESAQELHELAMSCGFRESGISIGKKKIMLAIRTTSYGLELPIAKGNKLLINIKMLNLVVQEANIRLQNNFLRIDKLFYAIKHKFQWPLFKDFSTLQSNQWSTSDRKILTKNFLLNRWGHVAIKLKNNKQILIIGMFITFFIIIS